MNENVKRLEKQLDLLYDEYIHAKTINDANLIAKSLYSLMYFHYNISDYKYFDEKKLANMNPYLYNKNIEMESVLKNKFINNFIKNKDFHFELTEPIIESLIEHYSMISEDASDELKRYDHSTDEMFDLLNNYYQDVDQKGFDILNSIIEDNRVFSVKDSLASENLELSGITYFDMKNRLPFIIISGGYNSISTLACIVHEIGHAQDLYEISSGGNNKLGNFLSKSSYTEVNSIYKEKMFYEYVKNNTKYKDEVDIIKTDAFAVSFEMIYDLFLLSSLPDKYLKYNKFNSLTQEKINKIFLAEKDDIQIDEELFHSLDIFDSIQYSYGNILASYFLEHPERYEEFKQNRVDIFDTKMLDRLGITKEEMQKSYVKRI